VGSSSLVTLLPVRSSPPELVGGLPVLLKEKASVLVTLLTAVDYLQRVLFTGDDQGPATARTDSGANLLQCSALCCALLTAVTLPTAIF